eukprot:3313241-Prymnesium_polylepis.1
MSHLDSQTVGTKTRRGETGREAVGSAARRPHVSSAHVRRAHKGSATQPPCTGRLAASQPPGPGDKNMERQCATHGSSPRAVQPREHAAGQDELISPLHSPPPAVSVDAAQPLQVGRSSLGARNGRCDAKRSCAPSAL